MPPWMSVADKDPHPDAPHVMARVTKTAHGFGKFDRSAVLIGRTTERKRNRSRGESLATIRGSVRSACRQRWSITRTHAPSAGATRHAGACFMKWWQRFLSVRSMILLAVIVPRSLGLCDARAQNTPDLGEVYSMV